MSELKKSKRSSRTNQTGRRASSRPASRRTSRPRAERVPIPSYRQQLQVRATAHSPSSHILRLKHEVIPESVEKIKQEASWERRWSRYYFFINEITIVSALAFIFLLAVKVVQGIFRLPQSVLPLPRLRRLSKDATVPLVRISHLKSMPFDGITRRVRAGTEWAQARLDSVESGPIFPRIAAFVGIALLIITPLVGVKLLISVQAARAEVLDDTTNGLNSFMQAGERMMSADYAGAAELFGVSREHFSRGQEALNIVPPYFFKVIGFLPKGGTVTSGQNLLNAAQALSHAGEQVATLVPLLNDPAHQGIADRWEAIDQLLPSLMADLATADSALSHVDVNDVPSDHREQFRGVVTTALPALRIVRADLERLQLVVPDLLGLDEPRKFLVVFENNNELRPTGGFMGTFAVVDVRHGEIQRMRIPGGGTYDVQGSLQKQLIAPAPLQLVNPRWEFQDANWWWDWPTSARKIAWFYSHADGETVDGVISLDASLVESLLTVTGPIPLPKYGLSIDAKNFVNETTAEVEQRYDKTENRPKQFLADLAPLLLERLKTLDAAQGQAVLGIVSQAINEKHLQIYRQSDSVERLIQELGWGGQVQTLPPHTDTLGVVHTNIAGGKTDGMIDDQVSHTVTMSNDGSLVDTVRLTRTHRGVKGNPFTGVRNVDYVRFYVPPGSTLLSAQGFTPPSASLFEDIPSYLINDEDIQALEGDDHDAIRGIHTSQQFGRTVFGNWIQVDPGSSATVEITYRLPWSFARSDDGQRTWTSYFTGREPEISTYQLLWEKQPGTHATDFLHTFTTPLSLTVDSHPSDATVSQHEWSVHRSETTDDVIRVTFRF